jgi:hypothetical protein
MTTPHGLKRGAGMVRKPTLVPEWKRIARKAWSIRLAALAAILSGTEVVLPLFADSFPRNIFASLSFISVVGAMIARLVAQPKMRAKRRKIL